MKKNICFIILSLIPMFSYAQFCVSEGGLKVCGENEKFIVYDFPGLDASEIYKRAKTAITNIYVSGKNVISENENEIISVNGISSKDIYCEKKVLGKNMIWFFYMNYNISMKFKNGKMRVDIPNINSIYQDTEERLPLIFQRGNNYKVVPSCIYLYDKKGNVYSPLKSVKDGIESFFNSLVNSIVSEIESDNQSEDW